MDRNELHEALVEVLKKYLQENIENYDKRCDLVWDTIDHYRCPLSFADDSLYNEMTDRVNEWLADELNDLEDLI